MTVTMRNGQAVYAKNKSALRSLQCCKSRLLFLLVFIYSNADMEELVLCVSKNFEVLEDE